MVEAIRKWFDPMEHVSLPILIRVSIHSLSRRCFTDLYKCSINIISTDSLIKPYYKNTVSFAVRVIVNAVCSPFDQTTYEEKPFHGSGTITGPQ